MFEDEDGSPRFRSVFDYLGAPNKPTDLFKPRHWNYLKTIRKAISVKPRWLISSLAIAFLIFLFPMLEVVFLQDHCSSSSELKAIFCYSLRAIFWPLYFMQVALSLWLVSVFCFSFTGVASLGRLVSALDRLLKEKVATQPGERVTFGDLKKQGMTLKIVASNLTRRDLRLFSTEDETLSDIPVADAIAASCAIPFVFRPVKINGENYCDGGMVSNLPAWTFDEKLMDDEQVWVVTSEVSSPIGSDLSDPEEQERMLHRGSNRKGLAHYSDITQTALFGASELNTRGISHHVRLPLPASLKLLDFDASPRTLLTEVDAAAGVATGLFSARLSELAFLREVYEQADSALLEIQGTDKTGLRAALVRSINLTRHEVAGYHLWACEGFDGCADEHLKLSKSGTLINAALGDQPDGAIADLTTEEGQERFFSVGRPGVLKCLTPGDRAWSMAFPLRRNGGGLGRVSIALTFDGSQPLAGHLAEVKEALRALSKKWEIQ